MKESKNKTKQNINDTETFQMQQFRFQTLPDRFPTHFNYIISFLGVRSESQAKAENSWLAWDQHLILENFHYTPQHCTMSWMEKNLWPMFSGHTFTKLAHNFTLQICQHAINFHFMLYPVPVACLWFWTSWNKPKSRCGVVNFLRDNE